MARSIAREFDLNQDGEVSLTEMEEAVKRSFSNVKHDITELKGVQERALKEVDRVRKDLDEFVHRDDFQAHAEQLKGIIGMLEKSLHEKETKLLQHTALLERRISKLAREVSGQVDLKSRLDSVEDGARKAERLSDVAGLGQELQQEVLALSSDVLALKRTLREEHPQRLGAVEHRLAEIAERGQYDSQVFITRNELESLARELKRQQTAQQGKIDQELAAFQKHLAQAERLTRSPGNAARPESALSAGDLAAALKEEIHAIASRLTHLEQSIRRDVKEEFTRELSRHQEKVDGAVAFLKQRMAGHLEGAVRKEELRDALGEVARQQEALSRTVRGLQETLQALQAKLQGIDDLRLQAGAMEQEFRGLKLTKADLTDLVGHNVSKHHFLKEVTQLDNHVRALAEKLEQQEATLGQVGGVQEQLVALTEQLNSQEEQVKTHTAHLRELKKLIDADIKGRFY